MIGLWLDGPKTTTWIWNLHADAHDFDSHTSDLEDISRKIFSAHFGHLAIIFIWLSGMYFHGAKFSNYEAWMTNPTGIKPSAQVVWPIFGQEILNADVGGGFQGIQITSGFLPAVAGLWHHQQLSALLHRNWRSGDGWPDAVCWLVPLPQAGSQAGVVPECGIDDEPPPLAGLLGLGCLSWAGHQIPRLPSHQQDAGCWRGSAGHSPAPRVHLEQEA